VCWGGLVCSGSLICDKIGEGGLLCCLLQIKIEEEEEMGRWREKGCLSGHRLNIIDGLNQRI